MSSTRSLRPRRMVALAAALALPFALIGPLAPTAAAKPDRPTPPASRPSAPTSSQDRTAAQSVAGVAAQQLKADRQLVAKAPSGVTSFVLWLESIEARKHLGPASAARVQADVRQLDKLAPKAVTELSKMSDDRAQRLLSAVVHAEMAPAFNATHAHLVGDNGFFLFVNVQRQLELMGRAAGSTGTVSFLPSLPAKKKVLTAAQHAREFVVDQDADGVSDAYDDDIDATGGRNDADPADNRLGIPEEFLVRTPYVSGPLKTDKPAPVWSSCFGARETIPRFMSVAALNTFKTARGCLRLGGPAAVAPGNLIQPTASGTPTVGATLTVEPGTWSGTPAPTFTFRWQYQGDDTGWYDIAGANSSTYVVQPSDSGRLLRANVTARNAAGPAEQVTKNIGPIGGSDSGPVNISAPEISGTPTVGGQLVADPGTWSGSPTSYGYQWQRRDGGSWGLIDGATASAYTPSSADSGDPLRVVVTASNSGGQATANSAATAAVRNPAQPPVNTALPAISGQTVIGSTLTTTNGTWSGSPDDYDYQWQRSTASGGWSDISGATRASYTATNADNALLLRVTVTADNDAGSAATSAVEVGPVTNPAGVCTVTPQTDTDKDGVADCKEIAGFMLTVATTGNGSAAQRKVMSDPNSPDTDGDKIADGLEWQGFASDPSSVDTDGDGLSDYQEFIIYKSLPANVDSDTDAVVPGSNPRSADPRLLDGSEVNGYAFAGRTISTSPTLSDTDGDSINDYTEINNGGYNPLVADMPKLEVGVPAGVETDIQIFTKRSNGTAGTTYTGTTTTSSDSTKTHTVDLTNTKTLNTNSTTLDAGAKGGVAKGKPFGEAHVNVKSTWQTGTVVDHQTGSTTDTIKSTQQQYEQYRQDTTTTGAVTEPRGELSTAITLHNPGKITYTAKNLVVTAFRTDPNNPQNVQPIASLALPDSAASLTLAPGETKGPYQVKSDSVSSDTLIALLANPSGIVYSIPAPSLVNATTGQDFAVVGQTVQAQTAGITVDDGSANPQTYLVATNVARNADGSAAGLSAKEALDSILRVDYGTCAQNDGRQVLCSVGDVATTDVSHFWSLLSSTDIALGGDFDAIHLNTRSVLRMVYVVDSDADGLFDPVENLFGTDIDSADTDGDSLTDYAETQTGWKVPAIGTPGQFGYQAAHQVFPNPLAADVDADSSPDACPGGASTCGLSGYGPESIRTTDPNLPDTNDDGVLDGQQANAQVLAYCPGCYRSPDFVQTIGKGLGSGDGQFVTGPGPIGVNPDTKEVYVADIGGSRIEKFGADGTFQRAFGSLGNLPGQFGDITGVAVDARGNVYVTSLYRTGSTPPPPNPTGQLQKFTSTGTLVSSVATNAFGVAVDSAGYVYTLAKKAPLDEITLVVNKYTPTLSVLTSYPSGQTNPYFQALPRNGATVSGIAVDPTGRIFTASSNGGEGHYRGLIERVDPAGKGNASVVPQAFEGVASDPAGHVYVTNTSVDLVLKVDPESLASLVQIGGHGTGDAQFREAVGVATDDDCNVYVSDRLGGRVQKFSYQTGCS